MIGVDADGDGCGEPVSRYRKPATESSKQKTVVPAASDEFDTRNLGLQWEWHANYQDTYGFPTELGFFRLYGHKLSDGYRNYWEVPNMLLQKFPAEKFTATAKMRISAKANSEGAISGLIVMGWDYGYVGLEKKGDIFELVQGTCTDAEQGKPQNVAPLADIKPTRVYEAGLLPNLECDVYLRVKVDSGAMCTFYYSLDGKKYHRVGEPFKARQGKWIGAKVGLFSVVPGDADRGWADIDWFRVAE